MTLDKLTISAFTENMEAVKMKLQDFLGNLFLITPINNYIYSLKNYYEQQYKSSKIEFIIYTPTSNPFGTIILTNIMDGYIQLFRNFSKSTRLDFYHLSILNNQKGYLNSYHFNFYSHKGNRHILCYQDPRWTFYEDGTPLPFEDLGRYKLRIKKQRLNKEVILHYLRCAGWDIEDENFWKPQGPVYLFERK